MTELRNVELYYIGGDGRENRPHPIMYGEKLVFTPPLGDKFPVLFTEPEAKQLIVNSAFSSKSHIYYSATRDKRVALALKQGRTMDDVFNNLGVITLSDAELVREMEKRNLANTSVPVKKQLVKKQKVEATVNA